jgi:Undecaprenyl-phosphate glucose phosphotransferase
MSCLETATVPNDVLTSTYSDLTDRYGHVGYQPRRRPFERISSVAFVTGLAIGEFAAILVASLMAFAAAVEQGAARGANYTLIAILIAVSYFFVAKASHLYKVEIVTRPRYGVLVAAKVWTILFLCLAALSVMTKTSNEYSRLWFGSWYISGLLGFALLRLLTANAFRICVANGRVVHSVVVIGASALTAALKRRIEGNPYGIKVDAVFDEVPFGDAAADMPADGNLDDLMRYQRTREIDTLILALPRAAPERLRKVVRDLSVQSMRIRILPGELALDASHKWYSPIGEIPGVQLMAVSDRPIALFGYLAKSVFDRTMALIALVILAPVMCACVVGIKLSSPGPLLFRQKRIGLGNQMFEVYKFRSMHAESCNLGTLTERNDPRVFKFGQLIRKLSFDELPQLFNVLKGDMSLVGPRPHMPEARAAGRYYFDVVAEYAYRHRVKPGITGWAQVNGWRGPTETVEQIQQRVSHDLYYIDNWSFGLDIIIMIKTVLITFFDKNAF